MARQGVKHLVPCLCVLPQLSKLKKPPTHEFDVFSMLDDESGDFDVTFVQCDNCGVVHKVIDVCTSAIIRGRDESKSVVTLADVQGSVPAELAAQLTKHAVSLATWQQVAWIVETMKWGSTVVLTSEYIENARQGKVMVILGETLFKIINFTNETVAG